MNARDILHQLQSVKRAGGGWTARCPAHDDRHNSLSVSDGDKGLLLYCHAGCTYEAIKGALGVEHANGHGHGERQVVATYDYLDAGGALLYQALRYEPKGFSQRKPDGAGGWVYKLNGVRRVLYRLPELLEADPAITVFVCEGEKDCDRLVELGLLATTNAGGAGKWRDEYSETLRGRNVVILPDNDKAGHDHAEKVARAIRGIAASVKIIELPALPEKGDVSDWLNGGGTAAQLFQLVEAAPEARAEASDKEAAPLQIVRMADVQPETVRWLWPPYIAYGKLTLLEGDPGLGKSWLTCALAAAVSCGRGLPGAGVFTPANVLMLSAEDGLGDTLRPRLDAVGADVARVFALAEPMTFDAAGLLRLEAAILHHNPALVIIDPLFAFTGGKVDIHRANECRAISAPLAAMAERCGCALVAVRHLGKSRGGGHALNAGIGSIDFTAAARSVLLVGQDPDEPTKRAIVQTKNNLAPLGSAIGYKLEESQFWWTGESDLTAGRILSLPSDEEERGTITDAVDFLRTALSDGGRDNKALKDEAKQAGISEPTLRRAKERLKVRVRKVGMPGSHYQKWVWELPAEGDQPAPEGDQESRVDHLRANDAAKGTYSQHLAEDDQPSVADHLRGEAVTFGLWQTSTSRRARATKKSSASAQLTAARMNRSLRASGPTGCMKLSRANSSEEWP
ncbi:MAG TPA: AAA family ATPase [Pyrinomonadaceae bacterium]